jgi:hypothetical protein
LRGDPLVYPQQRGGEHPYVVAQAAYVVTQATYLSANAVLFGEDAFELATEMLEVDGVGHGMILPDRHLAGPTAKARGIVIGGVRDKSRELEAEPIVARLSHVNMFVAASGAIGGAGRRRVAHVDAWAGLLLHLRPATPLSCGKIGKGPNF